MRWLVLLLPLLLVARPARAAEPLRLTWDAPAECPAGASVRAAAMQDVVPGTRTLEAEAAVVRTERGWRVTLRTRRGEERGERTIEASSCEGVADATVVVLGLALVDAPPPRAPVAPSSTIEAKSATRRSPVLAIGLGLGAEPSILPAAAFGASLSVAWTPGRWRLEADARRWTSESGTVAGSAAGARFSLTSLGARLCFAALAGSFSLGPCAGADAELASARGFGADANYDRSRAWPALTGGVLARLAVTRWLALRARPEAVVPLSRPSFVVANEGEVHRPPAIGMAATIGAELTLL